MCKREISSINSSLLMSYNLMFKGFDCYIVICWDNFKFYGQASFGFLIIFTLEYVGRHSLVLVNSCLKIDHDIVKNRLCRWSGFLSICFTTLCSGWSLDWIWKMKVMIWTCYWHSSIICNSYSYHSFLSLLVVFPKHVLGMSFLD